MKVKDKAQRHRNKVFDIIDTQLEYGYNDPGTVDGYEEEDGHNRVVEEGSAEEEKQEVSETLHNLSNTMR